MAETLVFDAQQITCETKATKCSGFAASFGSDEYDSFLFAAYLPEWFQSFSKALLKTTQLASPPLSSELSGLEFP